MITESSLKDLLSRAARLGNLPNNGPHILHHTFCSHLAMRGAAVRAIQEFAGHQDIGMTQRYMHPRPGGQEERDRSVAVAAAGEYPWRKCWRRNSLNR